MRDFHVFYLTLSLIAWASDVTSTSGGRNEKSQQTFVVRYRNGEQTIPVTVVLDDKKQTEYVINLSPRSVDKSVTLYDFKQRTIAYKDLTNKECFLGRLTDETLKQEIDALSEVKNPIESNPKILSLVPHRSALTPTEIRNIAGQKTAVFCRKMNTWLIMSEGKHTIFKRDVDEVEERTYKHHGFHTVHFSQYGHETRRRFRKPTFSQAALKEEHLLDRKSENLELTEPNELFQNSMPTVLSYTEHSNLAHDHARNDKPIPFEALNEPNTYDQNSADGKKEITSEFPPSIFDSFIPNHEKFHPKSFEDNFNNNIKGDDSAGAILKSINDSVNFKPNLILSKNNAKLEHLDGWDSIFHSLLSRKESGFNEKEYDASRDFQYPSQTHHRNIESEAHSPGEHATPKLSFSPISISDDHTENPDVSINVLELPKITGKFENLNRFQEPSQTFVQPKEDVHSIFERFHNLQEKVHPTDSVFLHLSENRSSKSEHDETLRFGDSENFDSEANQIIEFDEDNTYQERTTNSLYPISSTELPIVENTNNTVLIKNKSISSLNGKSITFPSNKKDSVAESEILSKHRQLSENNPLNNKHVFSQYDPTYSPSTNNVKLRASNKDNVFLNLDIYKKTDSISSDRANDTKRSIPLFPGTTSTIPKNQLRFRNILRDYKPDEIIIDIEKIPTAKLPDSTSKLQGKIPSYVSKENSLLKSDFENRSSRNKQAHSRNNFFRNVPHHKTQVNSMQELSRNRVSQTRKRVYISHQTDGIQKPSLPSLSTLNNFNTRRKQNSPSSYNQLYRLDNLPPGVSLHPRHPQAPYANMIYTNKLQTLPHRSNVKSHHQRHHRKKDRSSNSCCQSNGRLLTCCSLLDVEERPNSLCCPSRKHNKRFEHRQETNGLLQNSKIVPKVLLRKVTLPLHNSRRRYNYVPSQNHKSSEKKDRCNKEKMCRTLYQSTQQVMVCRNADIDGC